MPIHYSTSPDGEEVELRLVGALSSEEYVAFFRAALAQSTPPARLRTTLMDLLEGDVSQLSYDALSEVAMLTADEARRHPGPRAMAAVVRDPLTFGLTRQWEMLANDARHRFEFFRTREAAASWLHRQREAAGGPGEASAECARTPGPGARI